MSPIAKTGLGIVAIAPLLCFFLLFVTFFATFLTMAEFDFPTDRSSEDGEAGKEGIARQNRKFLQRMWPIFLVYPLFLLSMFFLPIVYIVFAAMNPRFDTEKRVLWIVLLFFLGIFAMPAYWIVHIFPKPRHETSRTPAAGSL